MSVAIIEEQTSCKHYNGRDTGLHKEGESCVCNQMEVDVENLRRHRKDYQKWQQLSNKSTIYL